MKLDLLSTDNFEVEIDTPITNVDVEVLVDLYLPIIGADGLASYLRLARFKEGHINSHDLLFEATGLSSGAFLSSRKLLEGIGLLKTKLLQKDERMQFFLYIVYPPVSGKAFLKNPLLRGTLFDATSNEYVSKMEQAYKLTKSKRSKSGTDISDNFSDVFHEEGEEILSSLGKESSRRGQTLKTYFSIDRFLAYLKESNYQIKDDTFTREELSRVEERAVRFNFNEESAADLLISSIDFGKPRGKRIDFAKYEKVLAESKDMTFMRHRVEKEDHDKLVIPGSSDEAKKMRQMERLTTEEFLLRLQGGGRLASSDRKLIESLREMYLKDSVINALLDYVLEMQDGSLPVQYTTKIAGSLARKGVDNPIDAYNYLHKGKAKKSTPKEETITLEKEKEEKPETKQEEASLDALWAEFDQED